MIYIAYIVQKECNNAVVGAHAVMLDTLISQLKILMLQLEDTTRNR